MQLYYPEGFLFSNAVYALSWAEVASAINDASPLYNEASEEITWAIDAINSEKGKARFDTSLQLPYGAFYTGWYTKRGFAFELYKRGPCYKALSYDKIIRRTILNAKSF